MNLFQTGFTTISVVVTLRRNTPASTFGPLSFDPPLEGLDSNLFVVHDSEMKWLL